MFGYVKPCIPELKIKDYEKFKSYYCGLCKTIKKTFGEFPRLSLNYDMTFLAILLDSLTKDGRNVKKEFCLLHPVKKRLVLQNNKALNYASFCNVTLFYYKLLDDVNDDKTLKSKTWSWLLEKYFKKLPNNLKETKSIIEKKLSTLYDIENSKDIKNLDEYSHPFSDLTGFLMSNYYSNSNFKENLYWFGYNLGKWIYLIDAYDDLKKDMDKQEFNPINSCFNKSNLNYNEFIKQISDRIDFSLTLCGNECLKLLEKLPIHRNKELLYNILQYGLLQRIEIVFKKRSENANEKPL